jgi:hypothetical protein
MKAITSPSESFKPFLIRRMLHISSSHEDMLEFWTKIVKAYTRRRLTYEDNRYNAIVGIATKVAAKIGDDLIAGMLSNNLHLCLSWITVHGVAPIVEVDNIRVARHTNDLPISEIVIANVKMSNQSTNVLTV